MIPPPPRSTLFPYTTLFRSLNGFGEDKKARRFAIEPVHDEQLFRRLPVIEICAQSGRSEEHTSELQSLRHLVCRLLLEKKKKIESTDRQFLTKKQVGTLMRF